MKRAVFLLSLMLTVLSAGAGTFSGRMLPSDVSELITGMTQVSRAVDMRHYAYNNATSLFCRARAGFPSSVLSGIKSEISGLVPRFVDRSQERNGTYDTWFETAATNFIRDPSRIHFPLWSVTGLLEYINLPAEILTVSPDSGPGILSEPGGIVEVRLLLTALNQIPFGTRQVTDSIVISTNFSQSYELVDINKSVCSTNGCEETIERIEFGQRLSFSGCYMPLLEGITHSITGATEWSVRFYSEYVRDDMRMAEDYEGRARYRDNTHTLSEHSSLMYDRKTPARIQLVDQRPKPGLAGAVKPYGRYQFYVLSPRTSEYTVVTHCVPVMCDELDEEANVIGSYECGFREVEETRTAVVQGWAPSRPQVYRSTGDTRARQVDAGISAYVLSTPDDPFAGVTPDLTHDEDYTCDGVTGPYFFGLWYYGVTGGVKEYRRCKSEIPARSLAFVVDRVLLELDDGF